MRNQLNRTIASKVRSAALLKARLRKMPVWFKMPAKRFLRMVSRISGGTKSYQKWVKDFDTLSKSDQEKIRAHISNLKYTPLISIVMPVYETPEWALRKAIKSIQDQLYSRWELCIADDASNGSILTDFLRQIVVSDPRVKFIRREINGNISAASNTALSLSTGEFIALMDHDDVLPQHALYEVVVALNENPALDIIFSDEDQIDEKGRRSLPYFKTDWNMDLLLGHNMISHLGVYRRSLVEQVGGFREGFEGSQDYDLTLRCADATVPNRICHIPAILYHWRRNYGSSFSERQLAQCSDAALRAIRDHLDRRHESGEVKPHPILPQWTRVVRAIPNPPPLISLIVPTRDRADLLGRCIDGLIHRTNYPAIEILIVDNGSKFPQTFELFERLKSDSRVRILANLDTFNFSAINNLAVAKAKGSIIGLINNDIDVINPDWLCEMVSLATVQNVGAVGAKLIYPNNRVQHAGIVLGIGGVANHFNYGMPRSDVGYFGRNVLTSTVSAVTGACLVVRKSVFEEVGGLNEVALAASFNDVDFCLRLREKGYRNVWTPHAELYHHESATRKVGDAPEAGRQFQEEIDYMLSRWGSDIKQDPFYNDNFSTDIDRCFQLAFPPRRQKPWLSD
jgi:GT2 family glycosyltransferase